MSIPLFRKKANSYFQSICPLINYTVSTLLCFKGPSYKSNIYHTGSAIYMRKPEIPVRKSNGSRHRFRLGRFRKYGLCFLAMQFFYYF